MADQRKSGITWCDETWYPFVGCDKVSEGCRNCWAERMAKRSYHDEFPDGWHGNVMTFPDRLEQPLHWKRPRKIAVGLMGDLWHPQVEFEFIDEVFAMMAVCYWHTFQLLTKRPDRMFEYLTKYAAGGRHIWQAGQLIEMPRGLYKQNTGWPLTNVWLGASIEDQKSADERTHWILQTPAAVRFVSIEPMLGQIDLCNLPRPNKMGKYNYNALIDHTLDGRSSAHLNWVIVGGESGPGARPCHPDWVRSIRDQCQAAGVPFHFKQFGEWILLPRGSDQLLTGTIMDACDGWFYKRVGKKVAGRLLDGREWLEFPEDKTE